ncbi:MAG: DUF4403 family protein [Bacteroidia bacterium]
MNISVLLSVNALEDLVNRRYDTVIYDGKAQNPDGGITHVTVTKNDQIRIFTEKQSLVTLAPVHIKVNIRRGTPGIFDLIRDFSNLEKTHFDISVRLVTAISVLPGWKLETHSRATFEWDKKPSAGPLNLIQIAEFVKPQLEKELQALAQNIDTYISHEINFAGIMENAWREITRPAPLPLPFRAMVQTQLVKDDIQLNPIAFKGKWILFPIEPTFSISLKNNFPAHSPLPLPGLEISDNPLKQKDFPFLANISWEVLNQMLDEKEITVWQGKEIKISAPEFFGFEDKIGVKASFVGNGNRWKGKFELLAECYFDEEKAQISFQKVFFRFTHASFVFRSFASLFRKKIEKTILSALKEYSFQQIRILAHTVAETLSNIQPAPGIELQADIAKLTIQTVQTEAAGILLSGSVAGELKVSITRLDDEHITPDGKT